MSAPPPVLSNALFCRVSAWATPDAPEALASNRLRRLSPSVPLWFASGASACAAIRARCGGWGRPQTLSLARLRNGSRQGRQWPWRDPILGCPPRSRAQNTHSRYFRKKIRGKSVIRHTRFRLILYGMRENRSKSIPGELGTGSGEFRGCTARRMHEPVRGFRDSGGEGVGGPRVESRGLGTPGSIQTTDRAGWEKAIGEDREIRFRRRQTPQGGPGGPPCGVLARVGRSRCRCRHYTPITSRLRSPCGRGVLPANPAGGRAGDRGPVANGIMDSCLGSAPRRAPSRGVVSIRGSPGCAPCEITSIQRLEPGCLVVPSRDGRPMGGCSPLNHSQVRSEVRATNRADASHRFVCEGMGT